MTLDLESAIDDFWSARSRGEFFPQAYCDRLTMEDAYRIQLALVDRRVAAGERQLGWKVGLTAKPIQEQFGFDEPVFGCVLQAKPSGHIFAKGELIHPGFETELCMRLGCGVEAGATLEQVRSAIDAIYPSFEITETRGDFAKQVHLALADNAQQHSILLGPPVRMTPTLLLDDIVAEVTLNGTEVARGFASSVLGGPLNSILWLATKLRQYGRSLRPGDLVMTGSWVRQFPLNSGDVAIADFTGLGCVRVEISKV